MDENKEIQNEVEEDGTEISTAMGDFSCLIYTVLEYYSAKSGVNLDMSDGDEWKKGTKYDSSLKIPKSVDELARLAFENQLKKFT